jgi:hypothetical protein
MHEGVPDWLLHPLLDWLERHLDRWSTRRIALRMRILLGSEEPTALVGELEQRAADPNGRWDLLDAIDYLIQMNRDDLVLPGALGAAQEPLPGSELVSVLDSTLMAGGSAYHVTMNGDGLERQASEYVESVVRRAAETAPEASAGHLRRAWKETYALHPDPTVAYGECVKAVEAVANPLVLPKAPKPTLGVVIGHLKDAQAKWEVAIPGKDDVLTLVSMLDLLWTGQVARHAGSPASRDHTQVEAEAALPLAATIVHWFAIGTIRRRVT